MTNATWCTSNLNLSPEICIVAGILIGALRSVESRRVAYHGRQQTGQRYGELGGPRRGLRTGHAHTGVTRELGRASCLLHIIAGRSGVPADQEPWRWGGVRDRFLRRARHHGVGDTNRNSTGVGTGRERGAKRGRPRVLGGVPGDRRGEGQDGADPGGRLRGSAAPHPAALGMDGCVLCTHEAPLRLARSAVVRRSRGPSRAGVRAGRDRGLRARGPHLQLRLLRHATPTRGRLNRLLLSLIPSIDALC